MYLLFDEDVPDIVNWSDVSDFFAEYGCKPLYSWERHHEMRWFEESWGALWKGYLLDPCDVDNEYYKKVDDIDQVDGMSGEGEVIVKFRAICLLMMYLSFRECCFDEDWHVSLEDMLDKLKINPVALANIAGEKISDVDALDDNSFSFHKMPDLVGDEVWASIEHETQRLIRLDNDLIYGCLIEHYGGEFALFASLWDSRKSLFMAAGAPFLGNTEITGSQLEGFSYVEAGMTEWHL